MTGVCRAAGAGAPKGDAAGAGVWPNGEAAGAGSMQEFYAAVAEAAVTREGAAA